MRALGLAIVTGLVAATVHSARPAPPPDVDLASPLHVWFDRQHSIKGVWCCNSADGHILEDEDWHTKGDHYEVRIQGIWYPVPDEAIRDPKGGPNPTGKAIAWYLQWGDNTRIFCFAPGFQT